MDKRPKRRKSKDNPYTLKSIEEKSIYRVSFNDEKGKIHEIDIDPKVFEVLNQFELDDLKQLNEYDRHIEHLEHTEESLYDRTLIKAKNIESEILDNFIYENLYNCISGLPETQKRRIKLYFFENMTMEEIAKLEKCSKVAVKHSIDDGIRNLKKNLKI